MIKLEINAGNNEILLNLGKHPFMLRKGVNKAYFLIGKDVYKKTRKLIMDPPKTGKVYRVRKGGTVRQHRASRAGQVPANMFGGLRRSNYYKVRQFAMELEVGETAPYASYLEEGTSKMEARPHMIKAIEETAGLAEKTLRIEIEKMLTQ